MLSTAGWRERLSSLPTEEGAQRLLACSLGVFVGALGVNVGVYPALCWCAGVAGLLLVRDIRGSAGAGRRIPRAALWESVYLPLLLFAYTAITPGHFLKDLSIASKMCAMWLIGFAAARLPRPILAISLLPLPLVLAASIAGSPFFGYSGEKRLCLGFSHPNVLGAVSAWGVLSVLALRDAYSSYLRPLAFTAAVVCAYGILLASSRAALLGVVAGSLFLFRNEIRAHFLRILLVCVGGIVAVVLLLPNWHAARLETGMRTPLSDVTFQSRLPIWEAAWEGFCHAPVLGNGVRTFEAWHKSYVAQYRDTLEQRYRFVESRIGNPHHLILGLLYMYGLAGMTLFAVNIFGVWGRAWRERDVFLLSVFIFFLVHGLFEFILHRKDGIFMLFFPFGLACGQVWQRHYAAQSAESVPAKTAS